MELDITKYEEYLEVTYNNQNTIKQYTLCARGYIKNVGNEITQDNINKFLTYYKKDIMRRSFISSLFRCFKIRDLDIPVERSRTKEKKRELKDYKFLELDVINFMIENCIERHSLLVSLLFDTGLRLNEVINIHINNINFEENRITGTGKGDKDFDIPFSNKTRDKLISYLQKHKEEYVLNYPFKYPGVRYSDKKFWRELRKECKEKLGLEKIHPHRIRHALGHFLRVNKGWDLEQVRAYMRHDNISTTSIYSTATKEEVRRKMVEEVFGDTKEAEQNGLGN